jgi:hypothetical protein
MVSIKPIEEGAVKGTGELLRTKPDPGKHREETTNPRDRRSQSEVSAALFLTLSPWDR